MNIFYLSTCPIESAQMQVDQHVKGGKMLVEAAQILSNCYSLDTLKLAPKTQKGEYRTHSYPFHPCCKWVQRSMSNYQWLVKHAFALAEERRFRTGSGHFSLEFVQWCRDNPPLLPDVGFTTPALAMKNYPQFMDESKPVESYRKFYVVDKYRMMKYTKRAAPDFWLEFSHLIRS